MKELLAFLVRSLAENPDGIQISEEQEDSVIVFRVEVPKPDMGRIIGKAGKTAKAIRTVVGSLAYKNNQKVNVQFEEKDVTP